MSGSLDSLKQHADMIAAASPAFYNVSGPGDVTPASPIGDPDVISAMRSTGVPVIPAFSESLSTQAMTNVLSEPSTRDLLVQTIAKVATDNSYDGVDLDFESMAVTTDVAAASHLAPLYVQFCQELAQTLHRHHQQLAVTVMLRTSDSGSWRPTLSPQVYDYRGLGRVADLLRVMVYDVHWPSGAPGGIAPIDWDRSVLAYTLARVPANKVELGVPTYSRDWGKPGTNAVDRTWSDTMNVMKQYDASPQWSGANMEPYFTYTDADGVSHIVWYSDAASIAARVRLACSMGLAGVVVWALYGAEDPETWSAVRSALPANGRCTPGYGR
ncbi:MAG: hypothetical protein J2P17_29505 [Mycobacterium sp.]|nr:hypothetical protein [Mycobacterium sp.]